MYFARVAFFNSDGYSDLERLKSGPSFGHRLRRLPAAGHLRRGGAHERAGGRHRGADRLTSVVLLRGRPDESDAGVTRGRWGAAGHISLRDMRLGRGSDSGYANSPSSFRSMSSCTFWRIEPGTSMGNLRSMTTSSSL